MPKAQQKPTAIKTVLELRRLAKDKTLECFISLAGGMVRSSKTIFYDSTEKKYDITHEIDGTQETLTESEMLDENKTNIGKALEAGALYKY